MATTHKLDVITGGITEVKEAQNSIEIKELAIFAVDEHNKKENAQLKFIKVVSAKQQVVAGMKYYITLDAVNGELVNVYEADVWVKPWENFKELVEFKFVGAPSDSSATT